MKINIKNRHVKYTVIALLIFSFVFPHIVAFIGFTRQGDKPSEVFNNFINGLFIFANWPSFLLKIYPYVIDLDGEVVWDIGNGLINPIVIIVNAIGWGLIGFVVGLIISAVKGRKQRRILTNKNEMNSQ